MMSRNSPSHMAVLFALLMVFVVGNWQQVNCEVDVPFFKRTDCGDFCKINLCADARKEDCHRHTQSFVPADGDCYCCDTCASIAAAPTSIDKKCKPDHCHTIDCRNVKAQECFDKGMAFAPRDNDCSCCDGCVSL